MRSVDMHEETHVEKKRAVEDAIVGIEMDVEEVPEKEAIKYKAMNAGVKKVRRDYAAKLVEVDEMDKMGAKDKEKSERERSEGDEIEEKREKMEETKIGWRQDE